MFFQLPPSLPPTAASPPPIVEFRAECKKGSRDCFPEDRVGALQPLVFNLKTVAIAALHSPQT